MKRRILAMVGLLLVIAGFLLLALSLPLDINFIIPVVLVLAAFVVLTIVKCIPSKENDATSADIEVCDNEAEVEQP